MTGWRTQIAGEYEKPKGVIGVVVAQKFPDLDLIREKLEEGIARVDPETVWVLREPRRSNHAVTVAWDTLEAHGIEPFLAPLVPGMKGDGKKYREIIGPSGRVVCIERIAHPATYDLRRQWRDAEMLATCERVIVFHDVSSHVTDEFAQATGPAKVFVIERGKKKPPPRKRGRKID